MPNTSIKKTVPGQQGFTLIEIIAVLVILGILAAVATPRFMGLQEEAKKQRLEGAISAAQSAVSMEYSKQILSYGDEDSAWDDGIAELSDDFCDDNVQTDGFEDDFEFTSCGTDDDEFYIEAEAGDYTAGGTFTRPTN